MICLRTLKRDSPVLVRKVVGGRETEERKQDKEDKKDNAGEKRSVGRAK